MSGKGIFITATDTGVGKTMVAAALARLLHDRGINVGVMKPVTSGCREVCGHLVSDDASLLAWGACLDNTDSDIAPYLLRLPIAPEEAASQDGVQIDLQRIADSFASLSSRHDFLIVEGAGGIMVPIAEGLLVSDLVKSLSLPVLVVARPDLGTINHTLLTCFSAAKLGINIKGVIINNFPEIPGIAEESAPHLIASHAGVPILGILPHLHGTEREVVSRLAEHLSMGPVNGILLREIGAL